MNNIYFCKPSSRKERKHSEVWPPGLAPRTQPARLHLKHRPAETAPASIASATSALVEVAREKEVHWKGNPPI